MKKLSHFIIMISLCLIISGCTGHGQNLPEEITIRRIMAASPKTGEHIEYIENGANIEITLPDSWEYRFVNSDDDISGWVTGYGLSINPKNQPDNIAYILYSPAFGMCGTGVTFEEVIFSNGIIATKCNEGESYTLFTFEHTTPSYYLAYCNFSFDENSEFGQQLMSILNSVKF